MSKIILPVVVSVVVMSASAHGQGLGVGIIAGEPTGVSVKKWLENGDAIDGAAAWSLGDHGAFQLHADYLWHLETNALPDHTDDRMPVYFGIGGRVEFRDHKHRSATGAGVRVPVGVTYLFDCAPFDVFVEVVPTLDVAPSTELDVGAAAGIRYYIR